MTPDLTSVLARLLEFRDARDWKQFHSLKNLVAALAVEASELLELTQWKTAEDLERTSDDPALTSLFSKEIADVLIYLLLISEKLAIDPIQAAAAKIQENEERYPVEKSKGSAKKYSDR